MSSFPRVGSLVLIPYVGQSYAGKGDSSDDEILGWRHIIPVKGARRTDKFFCTSVTGDSLENHSIFEGDYLVARLDRHAHIGDLIIAHTPNGRIIKYLFDCVDKSKIRLMSGNPKYRCVRMLKENIHIVGVVVRVERDLILDGREIVETVNEYGDSRRHDRYQFM